MSQKTNPKRILDNEAISVGRNIRVSPQKLNLVAHQTKVRKRVPAEEHP